MRKLKMKKCAKTWSLICPAVNKGKGWEVWERSIKIFEILFFFASKKLFVWILINVVRHSGDTCPT